jgi:hypothetical protein
MSDTVIEPDPRQGVTRCRLSHRLFNAFETPIFRRSAADQVPVMVVSLGEREAVLPLLSVQREFKIDPESEDGKMLELIAASLDFVSALRVGDPFPTEVLTGAASWEPDPHHLEIATGKLRLQLVEWLNTSSGERVVTDPGTLMAVAEDAKLRAHVQRALCHAAEALALDSASQVVERIERLGRELAYIEALRDRLLRRVREMSAKVDRLARGFRGGATQIETLGQVKRLTAIALRQIGARFEELESGTRDVITALRQVEYAQTFIREHRDWLYRSQRAWEPVLADWEAANGAGEGTLALLGRTYRFLAPRFMPVTEWVSALHPRRVPKAKPPPRMVW